MSNTEPSYSEETFDLVMNTLREKGPCHIDVVVRSSGKGSTTVRRVLDSAEAQGLAERERMRTTRPIVVWSAKW